MSHPLIERLTAELGWPLLGNANDVHEFVSPPGAHAIFVPGDVKRDLETPDVAVILPELKMTFQKQFDCAVVTDEHSSALREEVQVFKTPSVLFFREGKFVAGIPKVREWDEYLVRVQQILAMPTKLSQ